MSSKHPKTSPQIEALMASPPPQLSRHFPVGSPVEIETNEEALGGVYFTATVAECCDTSSRFVYVEYRDLLAGDDGPARLREHVHVSRVRPSPPPSDVIVSGFEPGDAVDAFYMDGWWRGVVARVVEGGGRFVVTFRDPPDELEFQLDELRVHLDWVGGSWVRPEKQETKRLRTKAFVGKKKKRGRSPNVRVESIQTPITGNTQDTDAGLTNGHSSSETRKRSTAKRTLTEMQDEKVVKELRKSVKRVRRLISDETVATGGETMGAVICAVGVEKGVAEVPCDRFDKEELSKRAEGTSPVGRMEDVVENGEKQREEENEKQNENVTQASPLVDKIPMVPIDRQEISPYVRNTALWKAIESMEVFQKIPQRPHFQPLQNFKEGLREGLVIGYMASFSIVVGKATQLQINDPRSITDDIMGTLADLEKHGFDVRLVRDRVTELLALKDKKERLVDEAKELDNQISERNHVRSRNEEEQRKINEQIKKLHEKLWLIELANRRDGEKIADLQTKLRKMEESIENVGREFEGVASSLLC